MLAQNKRQCSDGTLLKSVCLRLKGHDKWCQEWREEGGVETNEWHMAVTCTLHKPFSIAFVLEVFDLWISGMLLVTEKRFQSDGSMKTSDSYSSQ